MIFGRQPYLNYADELFENTDPPCAKELLHINKSKSNMGRNINPCHSGTAVLVTENPVSDKERACLTCVRQALVGVNNRLFQTVSRCGSPSHTVHRVTTDHRSSCRNIELEPVVVACDRTVGDRIVGKGESMTCGQRTGFD